MAGAAERLGAERHVQLLDPEAVQRRDGAKRAGRLRHQLGTDAVPREAGDSVRAQAHRRVASSLAGGTSPFPRRRVTSSLAGGTSPFPRRRVTSSLAGGTSRFPRTPSTGPLRGRAPDGASSNTWVSGTSPLRSARRLKRAKAGSSPSGPSSIPASAQARAKAWRPGGFPGGGRTAGPPRAGAQAWRGG